MPDTPPSANRPGYAYAQAHESELTPNQRHVLDLLVSGKTNAQVGEALGITLDGAKWNVSEVLSKLGFTSREEAAAYWRWRKSPRQRFSRAIRAIVGIPAFKWAAGGAGLVAAVAAGAFVIASASDDPEAATADGWFYLEADITVTSRAETSAGSGDDAEPEVTHSHLKWWMQDERHGRWELAGYVGVADGESTWLYREHDNSYVQMPLPAAAPALVLPMSFTIGPVYVADLDTFMASLLEYIEDVTVVGTDQLLGRDVTIIEGAPAVRTYEERAGGGGTGTESGHGSVRYWLDEERMLVLRIEVESGTQDVAAVVTRLDYPADVPGGLLRFEPPPGAIAMDTEAPSGESGVQVGDDIAIR